MPNIIQNRMKIYFNFNFNFKVYSCVRILTKMLFSKSNTYSLVKERKNIDKIYYIIVEE